MKEERVARPDVLSYEQGRQRQRMIFQNMPINIKDLPKEIEKLIQQAKAEVAREIFESLSEKFQLEKKHVVPCGWDKLIIRRDDWQSLKDKWLRENK